MSKITLIVILALIAIFHFAEFLVSIEKELTLNHMKSFGRLHVEVAEAPREQTFSTVVSTLLRKIKFNQTPQRGSDAGGPCKELCALIQARTEHFDLSACKFDITELGQRNHCEENKWLVKTD